MSILALLATVAAMHETESHREEPKMTDRIATINRSIVEIQARMHEIGGTDAENARVRELIEEREMLQAEERRAARAARKG